MNAIKVLLLSQSPLGTGGVERHLLDLIRKSDRAITWCVAGPMTKEFVSRLRGISNRVEIQQLGIFPKLSLRGRSEIKRLLTKVQPDVLHTHDPRSRFIAQPIARRMRIHTVHTIHMCPLYYPMGPIKRMVYGRVEKAYNRKYTSHLVFVSDTVRILYERMGLLRKVCHTTIHNGIDPPAVHQSRTETRTRFVLPTDHTILITVARLSREKNITSLLTAFERMDRDDASLVIIGDGPLKDELIGQARASACFDRVSFLGTREPEEVYELLRASDLFVLPSKFESLPYSVLEAASMGLPCVVSDVGGMRELVLDGVSGIVIEPNSVEQLLTALQTALDNRETLRQYSEEARIHASRFSVEKMVESVLQTYTAGGAHNSQTST